MQCPEQHCHRTELSAALEDGDAGNDADHVNGQGGDVHDNGTHRPALAEEILQDGGHARAGPGADT